MAVPFTLHRISISGDWRSVNSGFTEPLWEWALIWYVTTDNQLFSANRRLAAARTWRDWYANIGAQFGNKPVADGTFVTKWDCLRVSSGAYSVETGNFGAGSGSGHPVVPPQNALLTFGNGDALGRQTRKWIPNLRVDMMRTDEPKWSNVMPGGGILFDWAKEALQPRQVVGIPDPQTIMQPVVWDPDAEIATPVVDIKCAQWPRTQRRRVLSAAREFI